MGSFQNIVMQTIVCKCAKCCFVSQEETQTIRQKVTDKAWLNTRETHSIQLRLIRSQSIAMEQSSFTIDVQQSDPRKDEAKKDSSNFNAEFDLIGQYLELKTVNQVADSNVQQSESPNLSHINSELIPANKSENICGKRKIRERSVFHNFQKHLVTTLRKFIRIKSTNCNCYCAPAIAKQIWDKFTSFTVYTKRFLYILFGAVDGDLSSEQSQKEQRFAGLKAYSKEQLQAAQAYLRAEVVSQAKKLQSRRVLKSRRMKKSAQFQQYLKKFIEQLAQGPIKKRMAKESKTQLMEQMKIQAQQMKTRLEKQNSLTKHHQN